MTEKVIGASRDQVRGRTGRRRVIGASIAVLVAAVAVLWIVGRLPGAPMRAGPLEGTNFENLRARIRPGDTGMLWGSLVLHNPTRDDIVLDKVSLADNPQKIKPSAGPYIWDETRVALLDTGAVSGYQMPLPSTWKLPVKHPVEGFTIPPQDDDGSVEVLYEFPAPETATTVKGISVRYRTAGMIYRKTFDVTLTMCAVADPEPCDQG
ncbi:hypothetical protein [Winogradskya humida]|uniref:Uncharacterized protein n=1 Tax=Winogradskya humida TaxID=113566 RepID=A0ABQ3ZEQ3_9ACTN|nr:hypothetical protein [Actinoplanes humidus]GIE17040.1 hypothetical protein Ahu01nite_001420 [Actinoplanes humidus]